MGNEVKTAVGYAVVGQDGIDVRTVSPTERAAKVNWLWVNGGTVLRGDSDEQIADVFSVRTKENGERVVPVEIRETEGGGNG